MICSYGTTKYFHKHVFEFLARISITATRCTLIHPLVFKFLREGTINLERTENRTNEIRDYAQH